MSKNVLLVGSHERSFLNFRKTMISTMVSQGHKVSLAIWGKPGSQSSEFSKFAEQYDVKVIYLGSHGADIVLLADLWACIRLFFHSWIQRVDRALVFAAKPIAIGTIVLAFLGVKTTILMEGKGTGIALGGFVGRINRWLYQLAFQLCQNLIVLNAFDQEWVVHSLGANSEKVILFDGIGVEISEFSPAGDLSPTPTILYIGRLAISKGVLLLIQAFKIVRQKIPDVQLCLAGPPADSKKDRIDLFDLPCDGGIEYLGEIPRDGINALIGKSWAVAVPSILPEGLPMVIQEAFACERPAIASDVEGCRDALSQDAKNRVEAGWLVPPNDVASLARAIEEALSNPNDTIRRGKAGRKMALRRFNRTEADKRVIQVVIENSIRS